MSIHNFFMKITDLLVGDKAYIKSINCEDSLHIHLMELGLASNTLIKIINKSNYLITISFRNTNFTLTKDIGDKIDCFNRQS